jgi:hypothetical protein
MASTGAAGRPNKSARSIPIPTDGSESYNPIHLMEKEYNEVDEESNDVFVNKSH